MEILVRNRKAAHDYEILEKFIAGIVLQGPEVKSILKGSCSISEGFVTIKDGEVFLKNCNITRYDKIDGFRKDLNERMDRKLLLTKIEIRKIDKDLTRKGLTIIPLNIIYSNTKKIKVEIAVARGKKEYDKRETIKQKDLRRENG